MAYSGTVAQTTFETRKVIENALRRCKIPAEQITPEYVDIAKDQLFLMLSAWANEGVPLWTVQKTVYPLYEGVPYVVTFAGTVDVLNANMRTLTRLTGTDTSGSTSYVTDFTDATAPTSVGVTWSGASVPLEYARSDDGSTWEIIQSETPDAVAGEVTWTDLDASVPARYYRIRATSGTLAIADVYWGNAPYEIPLGPMNRDDYTTLPNKSFQSARVYQYWLDRQAASPLLRIWPVPDATAALGQVVVWSQRQIMDVGTLTQEIEVPQRWYEAVVAGLAAKLAMEIVEVDASIVPMLDSKAQLALDSAFGGENAGGPVSFTPMIGCYTR